MCGIAGIFNRKNNIPSLNEIKGMASTLYHRGPDGWGLYHSNDIALGHTRLSIIDLSGGNQPMMTERFVISYNGEIFNYIELRKELSSKGAAFNTHSDTEVIIKAFEIWGADALPKFNGQFAFLLWDKKEKLLYAARDRYGIRPLYVLEYNNSYYFASETKAFDRIEGFSRQFNIQNLVEHALLWNTLSDRTVFENIRSIESGTYEVYSKSSSPEKIRYYELGESSGTSPVSFDEAMDEFTALLENSIELRLRSDVPVANYLSGGIDSSIVTLLTAGIKKEKFKTFSVAFSDTDFDESVYQKEMAKLVKSNHAELVVDYDMIDSSFADAIYHFERPVFRTAPVPLFLLSKMVQSNDIKVVLTGEAADEILWGYDSFKELKLLNFWNKEPSSSFRPLLIKKLYPHLKHYKDSKNFGLMKMFYEGFLNDYDNNLTGLNIRVKNNSVILNYINKDHNILFDRDRIISGLDTMLPDNFKSWSLLQKNQFLEMKTLLQGYLLSSQGDRMSLAHGVEGRFPFLDHRIVEKVFYYNDNFKMKRFSQKHLLREAYKKVIPESITNRPKLPYMAPDLKSFLRAGGGTETAKYFLSDEKVEEYGLFNNKTVQRLLKKYSIDIPERIGYRDNMLVTFILSAQIASEHMKNKKSFAIDEDKKIVEIIE
ncbi:MAG: asparagine synthase (glutamine-hydrolyzing) [Spirochaetes bacterium]|nr:asparagine synthase (glutamine-hydrolyzing) [Spirochaetota bacterium]